MKLNILCAVNDSIREQWECKIFLQNMKENGLLEKTSLLIFYNKEEYSDRWRGLEKLFPEANLFYYKDLHSITRICSIFDYTPLFRLYVLQEHFKKFPELEKEAIFYVDSDILITSPLPFEKWLEDEINYLSWTGSPDRKDNYLWQPYFDSKIKQVVPTKLEEYKKHDILGDIAKICKTTREEIMLNSPNMGGAQYLLKNINSQFWTNCFNYACEIKLHLENTNNIFMEGDTYIQKQNNGFQAFCADMWAVLFQLIANKAPISCPKELDFAWSTDRIERLEDVCIIHNAGVNSDAVIRVAFEKNKDGTNVMVEGPLFNKGKYTDKYPEEDLLYLEQIYNNPVNKQFVNNVYLQKLLKTLK